MLVMAFLKSSHAIRNSGHAQILDIRPVVLKEAQSVWVLCMSYLQMYKIFLKEDMRHGCSHSLGGPTECWEGGVIGRLTFHCLYFSILFTKMLTCMSQDHRVKQCYFLVRDVEGPLRSRTWTCPSWRRVTAKEHGLSFWVRVFSRYTSREWDCWVIWKLYVASKGRERWGGTDWGSVGRCQVLYIEGNNKFYYSAGGYSSYDKP